VDVLYHSARAVESRTGLTNAQLTVLRQVARHGPLTVNEVAARVHAGQSAVSTVLARLATAKLVRRGAAASDRRRVLVSVTASGRRVLRRSPRPPTEALLGAVSRLTPAEAAAVTDGIEALLRRIGRSARKPPLLFQ
jgi:DNA-binding MarR family transcriptional regulator